MTRLIALVSMFFAALMFAFGQTETSKPMFFETPEACLSAKEGEFAIYLPHFTGNLSRWSKTDLVVDHDKTFCAEEWSLDDNFVKGWRIVRWPKNNSYFQRNDKLGDGRCGNSVRRLWEVPEQEISTPPPASVPMPERSIRERRERAERPQTPPVQAEEKCPTCVGIGLSYEPENLKKNSPDIEAWPVVNDGVVTDGIWTWNGVEIGRGTRLIIKPKKLYDMVHGKGGVYFLHFTGQDESGRVIACGLKGTPIELVRQGRHWFWKLPVTHCVYTYTHDIKKWKGGPLAEKLLACPAQAALAWWLWPSSGSVATLGHKIVPPGGVISPP